MNLISVYVVSFGYLFGVYLATKVDIYLLVLLIFGINKFIQLELFTIKGDMANLYRKNFTLYLFLGDLLLLIFLYENNAFSYFYAGMLLSINLYIYFKLYINLKLKKKCNSSIMKLKEKVFFEKEVNPSLMVVHFPMYFYLLTNAKSFSIEGVEKILPYSFLIFLIIVIYDLAMYKNKKNILGNVECVDDYDCCLILEDFEDVVKYEKNSDILSNVDCLLVLNVDYSIINKGSSDRSILSYDAYERYLKTKREKDICELSFKNNKRLGVKTIFLDLEDSLFGDKKERESEYVFVLSEYQKQRYGNDEQVLVVGRKSSNVENNGLKEEVMFLPTSIDVISQFKNLLEREKNRIIKKQQRIRVDLSFMGMSKKEFTREYGELLDLMEEINTLSEDAEMSKKVSLRDMLDKDFYINYNARLIRFSNLGLNMDEKLENISVLFTGKSAQIMDAIWIGCPVVVLDLDEEHMPNINGLYSKENASLESLSLDVVDNSDNKQFFQEREYAYIEEEIRKIIGRS